MSENLFVFGRINPAPTPPANKVEPMETATSVKPSINLK
jgi:hypothetical protein